MRYILILLFSITALFSATVVEVGERFQDSQSCKACHIHIVKEWEQSWHSKSHYKNDEYFRATTDYIKRKTRKSLNSVKIECATCHNPRISVTATGMDYEIDSVMGLDKGSDVNKALASDSINEGINCVVCHNIDKIHTNKDDSVRGINRIEWTKSGVMSGPYNDSHSPYHKVEHRDFMDKNPDQLCFVCHANSKAGNGLVFADMKSEYKKSDKRCVDCHMGERKEGVAATLRDANGNQTKRMIRSHGFQGAHTSGMWKDALALDIKQNNKELSIIIENHQPHNIPSGFGARELIVEISYKFKSKVISKKSLSLTRNYTSKRGKATIPHLAVKMSKDMSIPAQGKKVLKIPFVDGSTEVEVKLYYRLVNDEVRSILKLKEVIWSKKSFIASKKLRIK